MNFRRSVIIAELWRPKVARRWRNVDVFCVFFGETTPYGKIFKILFRNDSPPQWSTCCVLCSNLVKSGRQKWVKSCVIYLTKKNKISPDSRSRYCADSAQNLPEPAPGNALRVLQISSKSIFAPKWSNIRLKPVFKPNKYYTLCVMLHSNLTKQALLVHILAQFF